MRKRYMERELRRLEELAILAHEVGKKKSMLYGKAQIHAMATEEHLVQQQHTIMDRLLVGGVTI